MAAVSRARPLPLVVATSNTDSRHREHSLVGWVGRTR
jgi:hypothetical protein